MATITATKSGNWSDTTVWSGGVLPSINDVASSSFGITIDQDINVQALVSTSVSAGATIFTASGNTTRNITLNGSSFTNTGNSINILVITNSGTTNITTNMPAVTTNQQNISLNGVSGGTINIILTGNPTYTQTTSGYPLTVGGSNLTVNITSGDVLPNTRAFRILYISGTNNTVNWTGNITGASTSGGDGAIAFLSTTSTLNYTGTCTSNVDPCITTSVAGGTINLSGVFTVGSNNVVTSSNTTLVKISGVINNSGNLSAFYCKRLALFSNRTVSWTFQTEVVGTNKTMYTAGLPLGNPATTNVRSGVTYGGSGELTGTLIVPSPSNVRKGVPVDDTVGTADLTAGDIWSFLIEDIDVVGSIGERLKNASTVDTTGSQIASYNG